MKRLYLKEKAKDVRLSHAEIAELLGIHRVTVSKKFAGDTIYAGDVEFVVTAWKLLTPKKREALRAMLKEMRLGQRQPPPEPGDKEED
jgi:hypothetical protein